jgi:hypothetical protein
MNLQSVYVSATYNKPFLKPYLSVPENVYELHIPIKKRMIMFLNLTPRGTTVFEQVF